MFAAAAMILLALLVVAVVAMLAGGPETRVAAMQVMSALTVVSLLVLARALGESSLVHVALVATVMSIVGGLLFARFLEHWL